MVNFMIHFFYHNRKIGVKMNLSEKLGTDSKNLLAPQKSSSTTERMQTLLRNEAEKLNFLPSSLGHTLKNSLLLEFIQTQIIM